MADITRLPAYMDHTLLRPDATAAEIEQLCAEARQFHFFGVCVHGSWVQTARRTLQGCETKVIAVVGFPHGAMSSDAKRVETEFAVADGAQEIDFVLNIGRLIQGDSKYILHEIANVTKAAVGKPAKAILETCLLTRNLKIQACRLAMEGGAQYVKTSTGFGTGGATIEDVRLMRETVGPDFGVKASGGIRDLKTAVAMIEAGATRLGTSASVAIIKGEK
jgi:deoxyribose-phosphate aldolase